MSISPFSQAQERLDPPLYDRHRFWVTRGTLGWIDTVISTKYRDLRFFAWCDRSNSWLKIPTIAPNTPTVTLKGASKLITGSLEIPVTT